jgi:hypothetical protein
MRKVKEKRAFRIQASPGVMDVRAIHGQGTPGDFLCAI